MIDFTRMRLDNGLRVIIHRDTSTPMAAVNLLYDAGSGDEDQERTGLAHLLEHLMFGGSLNVPSYDKIVQKAGGENNAFTNNDITNYYIQLPAVNLETALWLESDRMHGMRFTEKGLAIQKSVVIEEFKQRYLNQPYGDIWLLLRPLAYKVHPYRWPTIGSEITHIENTTLDEVENFFHEHYCPSNAVLTITGNVDEERCMELVWKWFGDIERRKYSSRKLPSEPPQEKARKLEVARTVPYHDISMAYHMSSRMSAGYYTSDIISDLLAGGKSSRLYRHLVMENKLFSSINAYITGERDPGLFIIKGRLMKGIEMDCAFEAINNEINDFISTPPGNTELDKVKNKIEATRQYTHTDILHKAMDLSYYELLGDAGILNQELEKYRNITSGQVEETARAIFDPKNSSTLLYYSNLKSPKN
ncbi:MAG: M16 family metallopeptidase [Bacteroidales bacterium]